MDDTDRSTRTELLTGPLRAQLARSWPQLAVQLDAAAATERPGVAIGVRWTDGPTVEQVRAGLAPDFTDAPGAGYPVTLARFYSPTALAAALLALHVDGTLTRLLAGDRAAFWAAVESHLQDCRLPEAFEATAWQRAALLAELAAAVAGGDAYHWARWLGEAGWAQVNPALDAVFGQSSD